MVTKRSGLRTGSITSLCVVLVFGFAFSPGNGRAEVSDLYSRNSGGGYHWRRHVYNVLDWGANGTDAVDDTDEIQAAINYVEVNGGTLLFPPGSYLVESPGLDVDGAGVRFVGAGRNPSMLTVTGSHNFDILNVDGFDFHMENMKIGRLSAPPAYNANFAVVLAAGTPRFKCVQIVNVCNGVRITSTQPRFEDVVISGILPGGTGIEINDPYAGPETQCFFTRVAMYGPESGQQPDAGFRIKRAGDVHLHDCRLIRMGTGMLLGSTGNAVLSVCASNMVFDGLSNAGVEIEQSTSVDRSKFQNCIFTECGTGVRIEGRALGMIISNCKFYGDAERNKRGVKFETVQSGYASDGVLINSCAFAGNYVGVEVLGGSYGPTGFMINDCYFGAMGGLPANKHGVYINYCPANFYTISDNSMINNTVTNLVDLGTGGNKKLEDNLIVP